MRSLEVKKFIDDRQRLFWYSPSPKSETVSDELLVEMVLNYGSMDDLRDLFAAMGMKNVARINNVNCCLLLHNLNEQVAHQAKGV